MSVLALDGTAAREVTEPVALPRNCLDWLGRRGTLSDYANCLLPMLHALGWRGEQRQLAEAMPHFIADLDLESFCNTLANLNFAVRPLRLAQGSIDPTLMPCLFVPDRGSVRVLLGRSNDSLRIYDGGLRDVRETRALRLTGTAYIVRRIDDAPSDRETATHADWLAGITHRFRGAVGRLLLITLCTNVLSLATPLFIMAIYDQIIPSRSTQQLLYLIAGIGLALAFEAAFRALRARSIAYVAGRIDNILGNIALHRLLYLPIGRTENAPVGAQLSRLKEFESLRELFTSPIAEAMLDLPFVVLFVAVIAFLGGWIVAVPLAAAVLFLLASALLATRLRRATEQSVQARSWLNRFMVEAVSHVGAIKYSGGAPQWLGRFREASASAATADFEVARTTLIAQTISQTLMLGAGIAVLGMGAVRAMAGEISMGALVAVIVLSWRVLSPLQAAFVTLNQIEQIRMALRNFAAFVRLPLEQTGRMAHRPIEGTVKFSWVSHRYAPDADPVLFGVSFEIEKGEVIAITGPNGSGKSTIVNLLCGLYRPQAGAILIDRVDLRQMDPIRLRQQIGVVSHPVDLFYGTVEQNLRLSHPTASHDELVQAAKDARLYDDVMRLPAGFETRLTEALLRKLPAGFKQKLALARVYLRSAPIMIFDEATHGLDEDGDKAFLARVQRHRGKSTTIIVTHRPSHMAIADRVIVMNAGKVAAIGAPEEVLNNMRRVSP